MKKNIFKEVLNAMGEDAVKQMALDYINFDVDIWRLAECHKVPIPVMRKFLDYAIIHCLVTDAEALHMQIKSHANQSRYNRVEHVTPTDKRYKKLFAKRDAFKQAQKVNAELVQLYYKLETIDDFGVEEDGKTVEEAKSEIEEQIESLEKKLHVLKEEYEKPL